MNSQFTAEDGTEMTFELVDDSYGCQQFKVSAPGQIARTTTLVGANTEQHYKTLCTLLAWGIPHLERLEEYNSVER